MVKLLAEKLKDKKYDFILADVPALEKVCQFCTFSETVMALNYIDKLLLMLEEVVIESDGVLVITSPYGMAESMVAATSVRGEDYKCVPSSNPVPMLVISKETMANEAKSSILLHDIAFSNKSLSFIFTKILNCLNIGQSN
jgi:bisphosphoglycerate-independent phosphoglycerate mutase (AlkP superfamily)